MTRLVLLAIDLVAVSLLVFGLHLPRYRRRDLVVAYLASTWEFWPWRAR